MVASVDGVLEILIPTIYTFRRLGRFCRWDGQCRLHRAHRDSQCVLLPFRNRTWKDSRERQTKVTHISAE